MKEVAVPATLIRTKPAIGRAFETGSRPENSLARIVTVALSPIPDPRPVKSMAGQIGPNEIPGDGGKRFVTKGHMNREIVSGFGSARMETLFL
ncbi:MAG: hypothetical protein KDH19_20275 [Geminicoccaceae bacterium]|nr:hypothetical protein [Geminicoccaceae bacterium]